MSIVAKLDLKCDECGICLDPAAETYTYASSELRDLAAKRGWTRSVDPWKERDLCKRCAHDAEEKVQALMRAVPKR